jgi:biotin carboxyl carrier protein
VPRMRRPRAIAAAIGVLLAIAAVAAAARAGDEDDVTAADPTTTTTTSTTTSTTSTTLAPVPPPTTAAPATVAPAPTAPPTTSSPTTAPSTAPARSVPDQGWGVPFAAVGGMVLVHPSSHVERIGFHESNHDGAQPMQPLASAVSPFVMETRDRGNAATTAADIVVQPGTELRAPVTGTVLRGGSYTLYCDYRDEYVVIAPDEHPTWEVKVLHIVGVQVRKGQRVVAGETVLARQAHQLPFESQVDETRPRDPAWPHTHLEVVDPSIPDRPSPGC